jgi:hypothetical protein
MSLLLLMGDSAFRGALDSLGTGLAVAWSVGRRLRTGYTGNIIRVRRSSDNAESDFGYLANGSVSVAAVQSFCGAGDGFLTTIYDQSGNARNLTQSSTTIQPIVCESGVAVTENGRLVPKYVAAASRRMEFLSSTSVINFMHTTGGTFAVVSKANDTAALKSIIGCSGGTNAAAFQVRRTAAEQWLIQTQRRDIAGVATSGTTIDVTTTGSASTANSVAVFLVDPDNGTAASRLQVWQNGTQDAASNAQSDPPFVENTAANYAIGSLTTAGLQPFDGTISEIVIWSQILSTANRDLYESNAGTFYGITVA